MLLVRSYVHWEPEAQIFKLTSTIIWVKNQLHKILSKEFILFSLRFLGRMLYSFFLLFLVLVDSLQLNMYFGHSNNETETLSFVLFACSGWHSWENAAFVWSISLAIWDLTSYEIFCLRLWKLLWIFLVSEDRSAKFIIKENV